MNNQNRTAHSFAAAMTTTTAAAVVSVFFFIVMSMIDYEISNNNHE